MRGQQKAPVIPQAVPITDMNASDAGSMCSSVLANKTAVEVTVAILWKSG